MNKGDAPNRSMSELNELGVCVSPRICMESPCTPAAVPAPLLSPHCMASPGEETSTGCECRVPGIVSQPQPSKLLSYDHPETGAGKRDWSNGRAGMSRMFEAPMEVVNRRKHETIRLKHETGYSGSSMRGRAAGLCNHEAHSHSPGGPSKETRPHESTRVVIVDGVGPFSSVVDGRVQPTPVMPWAYRLVGTALCPARVPTPQNTRTAVQNLYCAYPIHVWW